MSLTYWDIQKAREEAVRSLETADRAVRQASNLIAGRLKASSVPSHVLEQLKKELRDYNMQTGEWK